MDRSRIGHSLALVSVAAAMAAPRVAHAIEYRGQVSFGGLPVPGATITATQGAKKFAVVTDQGGVYRFADLTDGAWAITVEMQCFVTMRGEVTISAGVNAVPGEWELVLLPLDELLARTKVTQLPVAPAASAAVVAKGAAAGNGVNAAGEILKPKEDAGQQSNDGFLVNGSSNNAARSQFALDQAFGNSRTNTKSLYTGGLAAILDNSAFDARPYSIAGLDMPKAAYNRITGVFTLGGPLNIPHVMRHGPTFFVAYQGTRDHTAETLPGLVPTVAERAGDLSGLLNAAGQPAAIYDPATGAPFAGNVVPVSAQAAALLQFYPLPNLAGNASYNYQAAVLNSNHQDVVQGRLDKSLGRKDEVYGRFNLQSTRASSASLFGFVDTMDTLGVDGNIHWSHRFSQHLFVYTGYRLTRLRTQVTPNFEDRVNVSGEAGIAGNDQDAANWGPPMLAFSSGIASLTDADSSFNRNRTDAFSGSVEVYHRAHNITVGGDLRKEEFNDYFEQNPRGSFTFTGAATGLSATTTGSDLADFLIGVPDTSAIAFGNADKYLRQPVYDLYATDDWRLLPTLTMNVGVRWEYGAPITELKDRLVNLDVAPGFTAAAPVLASDPVGSLTGSRYPSSLVRPDKLGFEPRVGISWRPIPASTVVVRAGYGVYHDTSVYLTSALQLAQQAPLSKSLNVENSAACPLTLADGFNACSTGTADTFALDPKFRVGYAQTWQVAVQRDLPAALQLTATYLGVKGTRGVQQILPNTYPIGATNPCPACPAGFVYRTSNGDSTRESGQVQLRRRLRSGFSASLLYTYSKSVDDDAVLGGQGHVAATSETQSFQSAAPAAAAAAIAQNWQDPAAERALSTFDQRHLLNLTAQYTTGQGMSGGTLMTGWRGRLLKEWTVLSQINVGSGLPETPTYLAAVPGTAYTSVIRPNLTGSPIYLSHAGIHLNDAAYGAPVAGQWGTAGRDSIRGPGQFALDASLARTFRPDARLYLDARVDATNLLNHAVFTSWDTIVNSSQFGAATTANPMRSLQVTLRLRF
jgi:hypothetical protein